MNPFTNPDIKCIAPRFEYCDLALWSTHGTLRTSHFSTISLSQSIHLVQLQPMPVIFNHPSLTYLVPTHAYNTTNPKKE
jgi:hypothetical protein